MNPAANSSFDAHEQIVEINDDALGLSAFIGIHSTALGPAAGGCRLTTYPSADAALTDVLRLSRGMTYKNAMADLPMGGGKAVIYRAPADRQKMFERMGEEIEKLGGRYVTAEDVGVGVADAKAMARHTSYVAGLPKEGDHAGGDPSPWTALGVFVCIQSLLGEMNGKRIAVQGIGAVGYNLCKLLVEEGVKLVAADVCKENADKAAAIGAEIVPVERIHAVEADVFAPCALGAGLNAQTIPELGAPIICGAANNQLATEEDDNRLLALGVTYAPDYIVNAGGIINVSAEYLGETADLVEKRVRAIAPRLMMVMDQARREGIPASEVADRIVRRKLAEARRA